MGTELQTNALVLFMHAPMLYYSATLNVQIPHK